MCRRAGISSTSVVARCPCLGFAAKFRLKLWGAPPLSGTESHLVFADRVFDRHTKAEFWRLALHPKFRGQPRPQCRDKPTKTPKVAPTTLDAQEEPSNLSLETNIQSFIPESYSSSRPELRDKLQAPRSQRLTLRILAPKPASRVFIY